MDASTTTKASYQQPVIIGGLVMGVLSALPVIKLGNLCCCLWVVTGGLVAAYVLQQNQSTPIAPGDGALVGLLAALVGAVVTTIISIPIDMMVAPLGQSFFQRFLDTSANLPPEVRERLENLATQRADIGVMGSVIVRTVGFVFFLIVGGIFSTLGGLLGAVIFSKKAPPVVAN